MAKYVCTVCGYIYDEAVGEPDNGIAAGTKWEDKVSCWKDRNRRLILTGKDYIINRNVSGMRGQDSCPGGKMFFTAVAD